MNGTYLRLLRTNCKHLKRRKTSSIPVSATILRALRSHAHTHFRLAIVVTSNAGESLAWSLDRGTSKLIANMRFGEVQAQPHSGAAA
jgi:hypothetical protein